MVWILLVERYVNVIFMMEESVILIFGFKDVFYLIVLGFMLINVILVGFENNVWLVNKVLCNVIWWIECVVVCLNCCVILLFLKILIVLVGYCI